MIEKAEQSGQATGSLVRQLGLGDSISIIMGIMIGSGIFLMAGSIAREVTSIAGVIAIWALGGSKCAAANELLDLLHDLVLQRDRAFAIEPDAAESLHLKRVACF